MSFRLPVSLFAQHRLIEDGELVFRLNAGYRGQLLAGSDAPLPAQLPGHPGSAVEDVPRMARQLAGICGHLLRLDDAGGLLADLIDRIGNHVRHSADGSVAALFLASSRHRTALHAVHCALLAARMSAGLAFAPAERRALVGAALTMNAASATLQDQMAGQSGPPSTLQRQLLSIHPPLASALLREAGIDDDAWHRTILMHHERRDGRGYPFGAHSADIPRGAQVLHLIDIAVARLMPRTYRAAMEPRAALAGLYAGIDEAFEAGQVAALVHTLGIYPPGCCVELENGSQALVIRHGANAATPLVAPLAAPQQSIDTAAAGYHVRRGLALQPDLQRLTPFLHYWS